MAVILFLNYGLCKYQPPLTHIVRTTKFFSHIAYAKRLKPPIRPVTLHLALDVESDLAPLNIGPPIIEQRIDKHEACS